MSPVLARTMSPRGPALSPCRAKEPLLPATRPLFPPRGLESLVPRRELWPKGSVHARCSYKSPSLAGVQSGRRLGELAAAGWGGCRMGRVQSTCPMPTSQGHRHLWDHIALRSSTEKPRLRSRSGAEHESCSSRERQWGHLDLSSVLQARTRLPAAGERARPRGQSTQQPSSRAQPGRELERSGLAGCIRQGSLSTPGGWCLLPGVCQAQANPGRGSPVPLRLSHYCWLRSTSRRANHVSEQLRRGVAWSQQGPGAGGREPTGLSCLGMRSLPWSKPPASSRPGERC